MLNRAAVILKYKELAVQWINDADLYHDDPQISLDDVNCERTAYLISDHDADDDKALERWIKANYATFFEAELGGCPTINRAANPAFWPIFQLLFTP